MVSPVRLPERLLAALAVAARLKKLAESVPPYAFPDLVERKRALEEAELLVKANDDWEKPFKPFDR